MNKRSLAYFALGNQPSPQHRAFEQLSIDNQVKWCIISAGLLVGYTPDTLREDFRMTTDLLFTGQKFSVLCIYLQKLVIQKNGKKQVKCADISDAKTVDDEIKLVNDAITGKTE